MSTPPAPPPSWVPGAAGGLHDADNLPYGVFATAGRPPRVGARVGDHVVDLAATARADGRDAWLPLFEAAHLDALMAAGPDTWSEVRHWLTGLVTDTDRRDVVTLHDLAAVSLSLPVAVGDFVDFYASLDHATNVGRILRPDGDPLAANWRHLPVGYHGRAGSIVVSGTGVHRPSGQRRPRDAALPTFGPSARLDVEAELGFVIGQGLPLGQRATTADLEAHVFGVLGLNDWSARDIQAWEYVPLGPHLGKSFATSVAAWVTPLAALEHARVELPEQEPAVLPYLAEPHRRGLDIDVEVEVDGEVVARPRYAAMYWSPAQMLAHLTVNGASLRVGDLFASGTISGPERHERGSFLELSWGGREPWTAAGRERTFLEDGDEVVLRYTAPGARGRIGLGSVHGTILPAL